MKIGFYFTLFLVFLLFNGSFCIFRPKNLTSYQKYLKSHKYTLSLYYHPNCRLSLLMKTPFKKAEKALKLRFQRTKNRFFKEIGISLINVQRLGINIPQTPKILIFRSKTPYKAYLGDYNKEIPLLDWFIKEIGRDIPEITSNSGFYKEMDSKGVFSLLIIDENDLRIDESLKNLCNIKEIFKEIHIKRVFSSLLGINPFWQDKCFEGILLLKDSFNKEVVNLSIKDCLNYKSLLKAFEDFFYGNKRPFLFEEVLIRRLLARKHDIFLYYSRNSSQNTEFLEILNKFIVESPNSRLFIAFDAQKDLVLTKWVRFLGISNEKPFALVLLTQESPDDNILKYHYNIKTLEITPESLKSFYSDFQAGILPYYRRKSQKETFLKTPNLIELNSDSYEAIMRESNPNYTKDLVIAFCPYSDVKCLKFLVLFEEITKELFHLERLVFGVLDPETEDFKGREVRVIPTIRLFSAGKREYYKEFEGNQLSKEKLHMFLRDSLTILNSTEIRRNPL